jgi:phosphoglycerate dehydrogenase-like enzyme
MLKGMFVMKEDVFDQVYPKTIRNQIEKMASVESPLITKELLPYNKEKLKDIEVLFTGWGGPKIDHDFLEAAPCLKAVFYAAGSVKGIVTEEMWKRGIKITSAYAANAIPVAEFTLSQILFSLKRGWQLVREIKKEGKYKKSKPGEIPGAYNRTVGLVSLGMVGKKVCDLLKSFDLKVIAYEPFVTEEQANSLNVELCSLEKVFENSDVVSIHTPWLKETEGMITGKLLNSMKLGATLINTSRGAVVNESQLIDVLTQRKDLMAVLDVTYPEPPEDNSPIITLPNVLLTPHIAGSEGSECARMGQYMLDELDRYVHGKALKWEITRHKISTLA